jgi:hypothetical protein
MTKNKRLRFHLARGKNYRHWQLKGMKKEPIYFDPENTSFILKNVKLYNKRNVAQKIYEGANKDVCAWLSISGRVMVSPSEIDVSNMTEVSYNPRVAPFWTYKIVGADSHLLDIDFKEFDKVIINKTKIYVQ